MSLPAADDLFRSNAPGQTRARPIKAAPEPAPDAASGEETQGRVASGRVRHDEKMTVYVTADELLDLEAARLQLRRQGLAVDRGRLVRAAIAMALADLDEHGDASELVRRLSER